jgi:acyl-CoA thioesterase-1
MTPRYSKALTLILAWLWLAVLAGCSGEDPAVSSQAPPPAPAEALVEGTIVAVGDSLTAGYGLSEDAAYPALLERRLRADGYRYTVVNAGISGETSTGAANRMEWIMTLNPDIVILATGANDGLRGIDPALTRKNIDGIVADLRARGVVVVLAGMKMVKNMGREFTDAFEDIYPSVAEKHDVILIPFFLEGVAAEKALNQADGIHPTAEGYEKVTGVVYPYVVAAIERCRGKG